MSGRYGDLDYPLLTKRSMLLGLGLFVIGALGEFAINAGVLHGPAWEGTLLFSAEVLGVLVLLLTPFVFGILLPLTE